MTLCNNSAPEPLFGPSRTFRERVGEPAWERFLGGLAIIERPVGWPLMHQGETGDYVVVVVRGVVGVRQAGDGSSILLRLLAFRRGGDLVGDLAVLGPGVRTATVRACTACEVAIVPGERFRSPAFQREWGLAVSSYIAGREREAQMLSRAGDDLARLACVLVPLLGNDGTAQWSDDGVYLKVCRQDLAACLGIGARRLRQVLAMPPFGATPGGRRGWLLVKDPRRLRVAAARHGGPA
ncbi:CRP-like cAMP-binding protein [Kitasatospora sp. MAA19]|uniref:cyclic nucleotide-binding domain-containing protein n=1 Tax=Kitasatospora sp. MAA19 TaxID=3035090 RepID=UPI002474C96C|nr:cyclic nucleotide-binding domain-containing protein [Kitasatospora sp. MAA19]MDH6708572.1 CRP-like cAMP-binding protein [Kitasatospora sp. MAA19]